MSQHKVTKGNHTWVFGWDQMLMSFFLQVHFTNLAEDYNPVIWLGSSVESQMYEVEDFVREAKRHGLDIDADMQAQLYGEKDAGS